MRIGQQHHRSWGMSNYLFHHFGQQRKASGAGHAVFAIEDYGQLEAIGFHDVSCAAGMAGGKVPIQ